MSKYKYKAGRGTDLDFLATLVEVHFREQVLHPVLGEFERHRLHQYNPVICVECGRAFPTTNDMGEHLAQSHDWEPHRVHNYFLVQ